MAHPECREEILALADYIGSTSGIIDYATETDCGEFIICTERGVEYKLKQQNPDKKFYFPGVKWFCPNMKRNSLDKIIEALSTGAGEVHVDDAVRECALKPLDRMLELAK